jgi:plasmid stabilization system protein ParE
MKPRAVKLSKTFNDQLVEQIDYGEQRFGTRVAEEKKERVLATIANLLANNPAIKRPQDLQSEGPGGCAQGLGPGANGGRRICARRSDLERDVASGGTVGMVRGGSSSHQPVARMSHRVRPLAGPMINSATCGTANFAPAPGYRCAHPGYLLLWRPAEFHHCSA